MEQMCQLRRVRGGRRNYLHLLLAVPAAVVSADAVFEAPRAPARSLPSISPWPRARRRHSKHKNYCRRRRKNTPKKNRARTRCRYCDDKRAGVHWTKRNKKGCARLPTCITKEYAPRKPGELGCARTRPFSSRGLLR